MFPRGIAPSLLEALSDSPVVFLAGARQVGKSTLAKVVAEGAHPARYLTLDDAAVLAAAQGDPTGFVSGLEGRVVLDEVQRAPDLFLAIKASVDRDREPGRFLLTGSANVLLLPALAETLTGRMEALTLWPLSQAELSNRSGDFLDRAFRARRSSFREEREPPASLRSRIVRGGYPEVVSRKAPRRRAWFESYVATILQRDVRDLANIERLSELPRLLALLASRVGTLVNYSEISRSSGLPQTTLKRYVALLETAFLVVPLPAWSANLGKRLTRSPKLSMVDSGLTAALMGADEARLQTDGNLMGRLLEDFVVGELRKQASWSELRPRLFHFRTANGVEVDVVLEDAAGTVVGVEVKASSSVEQRDVAGLRLLSESLGERFRLGIVLYSGEAIVPFASRILAVPISNLWSE